MVLGRELPIAELAGVLAVSAGLIALVPCWLALVHLATQTHPGPGWVLFTLVVVFLTMAAVLVFRPQGLKGLSAASLEHGGNREDSADPVIDRAIGIQYRDAAGARVFH